MVDLGRARCRTLWSILTFLLLADRLPAKAQTAAQPGATPRAGATAQSAQTSQKPAWKWTVEERLAKRFDPEARAARAREQAEEEKAYRDLYPETADDPLFKTDYPGGPPMETIDGKKTPELFMVWELFTFFLARSFPANGQVGGAYRERIEQRAAALGFGQDLWPRLEKATAPFIELLRESRLRPSRPEKRREGFKLDPEDLQWCYVRARAIAAAKAEFGEEAFLRLLYEAAAPNVTITGILDAPGFAEHHRFVEGGCK